MPKYKKPDGQGGVLIYTLGERFEWTDDAGKAWTNNNPDPALLASEGWIEILVPVPGDHERVGPLTTQGEDAFYPLVPWTAEEIQAETDRLADNDLMELQTAKAELAFWVNLDDATIDNLVDSNVTTVAGARLVFKKIGKAVSAVVTILDILKRRGLL